MRNLTLINKKIAFITLIIIFSTTNISAQTSAERGLEIAKEAASRDDGWVDSTVSMQMILTNRHGLTSERNMRMKSLEVIGDGDKSLFIFDTPRDIRGTAFLTFSHIHKPDQQWMYLPALKRVKRISSRNKSGPFMGSEFAFEDLSSQEVERFTYNFLREEPCNNGANCWVMERFPVDKFSGYTKQIVWLDSTEYKAIKIDFYDRKHSLLKTLTFLDYQQHLGKFWRANKMQMVNHQTGKSTKLLYENFQFNTGLTQADFNRNALQRLR